MSEWSSKFKENENGEGFMYNGVIHPNRIIGKK